MDLDADLAVLTADGVVLDIRLAGPAARGIAASIDHALAAITVALVAGLVRSADASLPVAAALAVPAGLATLIALEWWGPGRSPGKRAVGLRVVARDGTPPPLGAIVVRNVLRLADLLPATVAVPVPYGVGLVVSVASPRRQRLGDHAAGTLVVWDRPAEAVRGPAGAVYPAWAGPLYPTPAGAPYPAWAGPLYPTPAGVPYPARAGVPHPNLGGGPGLWPTPLPDWYRMPGPPTGPPTAPPPTGPPPPAAAPAPAWDVRWVGTAELAIARRFLARRVTLSPASRAFLATQLHARMAGQVSGAPRDVVPEAFVEYVVALRAASG